jgi:putative oxidoreductase
MAISRRIARPLLASIFIAGGIDALRNPSNKVKKAETVTGPLSEQVDFIPNDPEVLVRINGAVQVGAGVLLATGKFRRIASLALCGSIIPTTLAGHRFWEEEDEAARIQQQMHFLKNLALLGGLILAAVDTEGEPSLGWRARRRGRQFETAVGLGRAASTAKVHRAGGKAKATASDANRASKRSLRKGRAAAGRAGRRANATGIDAAHTLAAAGTAAAHIASPAVYKGLQRVQGAASDAARFSGGSAHDAMHQAASVATQAANQLEPVAQGVVKKGLEAVEPLLTHGAERAGDVLSRQ